MLKHLQKVTEEFVKRVGRKKGLPPSTVDNLGGKIFSYGSYTIGVHGPTSDIDTLVVAPKTVDLKDYFSLFEPTFKEMSNPALITSFVAVPDAFVPIIKLEYEGVDIDLIFASLPSQSSISRDFTLNDQQVLRGLDDDSIRSVNGVRTAKEMLELVPQQTSFRHALRAIKVWANKRGIYGFVFGFPGGIAWALMVARVCQLYPFACGWTILSKFFTIISSWAWPRPILLKDIETSNILNLIVWNPVHHFHDKAHMMPIITPAYPSMCCTHSITNTTLKIMNEEFGRAIDIVNGIADGRNTWTDLFQRHTFFTQDYKYYLSVIVSSTGDKDRFDAFSGRAQSKVRLLAKSIEHENSGIEQARVYVKGIERVHRCSNENEVDEVRQGNMKYQISADQASNKVEGAKIIVYTTTWYVGLKLAEGMSTPLRGAQNIDLGSNQIPGYLPTRRRVQTYCRGRHKSLRQRVHGHEDRSHAQVCTYPLETHVRADKKASTYLMMSSRRAKRNRPRPPSQRKMKRRKRPTAQKALSVSLPKRVSKLVTCKTRRIPNCLNRRERRLKILRLTFC